MQVSCTPPQVALWKNAIISCCVNATQAENLPLLGTYAKCNCGESLAPYSLHILKEKKQTANLAANITVLGMAVLAFW